MKTYKMLGTSKGGVIPVSRKGGEWVTADVAQGLYDALEDAKKEMEYMKNEIGYRLITLSVIEACESALAAADGEAK